MAIVDTRRSPPRVSARLSRPPQVELAPHAAPPGLAFYTGRQFPPDYVGDLLVALHVLGRPVDLVMGRDGSLLVSDDHADRVYRVSYTTRR
jgi:glucose/arabinose dehydrogenase